MAARQPLPEHIRVLRPDRDDEGEPGEQTGDDGEKHVTTLGAGGPSVQFRILQVRKIVFMNIDGLLAQTVMAVAESGTLDAAAARLHVTPSAVSQRLKTLETQLGQPVLHRTRPVELTGAGEAVLRFARQLEQLGVELGAALAPDPGSGPVPITVVVNADSLHTWALPPLASLAERVAIEVLREDEAHSLALLRSGAASGAVTVDADPVPGCSVEPLGIMRYLAVCTPDFAERWFADGVSAVALGSAPVVAFDRKDELQRQCLRRLTRAGVVPPTHYVPASAEYAEAIGLGMGWGMIPQIECREQVRTGELVRLHERAAVDVALYWQQWRRGSALLGEIGQALQEAARVLT